MDDHERGVLGRPQPRPGGGPGPGARLLSHFGTLADAWSAPPAVLAGAGVERRVVEALVALRSRTTPAAELEQAQRAGARVLTWLDEDYPPPGDHPRPPPVLYVRGTLLAQDERAVAVVGTRRPRTTGVTSPDASARPSPGPGCAWSAGWPGGSTPRPTGGARRRGAHPGRPGARPGHRLPSGERAPGGADRGRRGLAHRVPSRDRPGGAELPPATGSSPAWWRASWWWKRGRSPGPSSPAATR